MDITYEIALKYPIATGIDRLLLGDWDSSLQQMNFVTLNRVCLDRCSREYGAWYSAGMHASPIC